MTRLYQEQLALRDRTSSLRLTCPHCLLCRSNTGPTFVEPVIPGSSSRDTLMCQGVLSQAHTHTDRLEGRLSRMHTHTHTQIECRGDIYCLLKKKKKKTADSFPQMKVWRWNQSRGQSCQHVTVIIQERSGTTEARPEWESQLSQWWRTRRKWRFKRPFATGGNVK